MTALLLLSAVGPASAVIRDGGIDPANLGQGGWLYLLHDATNHLSPNNIPAVTNENSLFQYLKGRGLQYVIMKVGTSNALYYDNNYSRTTPILNSNTVYLAHANGLKIFGSNRSWGNDLPGETNIANYTFTNGADGFIFDAEGEWETTSQNTWITNGPAQAWWLCSHVRNSFPTKFIAYNPFDTLYLHSTFPYKEFGYWCDAVMPQAYHHSASQGNAFAAILWTDVNYGTFQKSLASLPVGNSNGLVVYWTNAIKPLTMMRDVYGVNYNPAYAPQDVRNFVEYLAADPNCVTAGGYQGSDYFRSELYDPNQWANISNSTIGVFPGVVNNIILDDTGAKQVGSWHVVKTIDATTGNVVNFTGDFGTDTNSFGTNYWRAAKGTGAGYMQFTPNILTSGEYQCYAWHPTRPDASASVPHIIAYNGGTNTVLINQQTNGGNWTLLGQFGFAAGTGGYIRVTDGIAESGDVAMVDGIKLVFASAPRRPSLLSQPQGATIFAGQTNTFSVTADGTLPLSYQWKFNGADISGATASTLTVGPAGPANAGLYAVRVSNPYGTTNSTNANLVVLLATANGDATYHQTTVPVAATNLVAVAAGAWHSLGLSADGMVLAWGNNDSNQCDVPATLTNTLAIAAGGYHSLAIQANEAVAAWGANDYGQTTVPAGLAGVIGIAAGTWHSVALCADGTVCAWGDNTFGQTNVPAGLSNVVAVAAGGNHSLALRADGTVAGWGQNTDANGHQTGQATPPAGLSNVVAIAAGEYHSLAVKADGTVVAWGDDSQEQCDVPPGLTNVLAVAGGSAHSLALVQDGTVAAWGADFNGQCDMPQGWPSAEGVAAGAYHTLLLLDGVRPVARLLDPRQQGQRFSALAQTLNRKTYVLESRASLAAAIWTGVSTNRGNGALEELTDPAASAPQIFYHMRQY
ncbi:MAG TPA: hypothetical protein VMU04_14895 [Candidatus Acidoferrum sp.]|nr:hypothetical protein [Candidatus Acidoferrum sp.]